MRKFVTAGIGVAALAATVGLASPAAHADTALQVARPGDGFQSGTVSTAAAGKLKRIGRVHNFAPQQVRGAEVTGKWYWAKRGNGPSFVYLAIKVKDIAGDGKSAGVCWELDTPKVNQPILCHVNTRGNGKTVTFAGDISDWNHSKMRVRSAVGKLQVQKGKKYFVISAQGHWFKLH